MINLLPQKNKKDLKKEYYLRLGAAIFVILASLVFVSLVLLTPSYFIVMQKNNAGQELLDDLNNSKEFQENKELGDLILDTRNKLVTLSKVNRGYISEMVIAPLLDKVEEQGGEIKLTSLGYSQNQEAFILEIRGVASKRDKLVSFVTSIQDDPIFADIEVPVSSFVQNENIPFQAVITFSGKES